MEYIYYNLINKNIKTIEDVPEELREKVQHLMLEMSK